MRFKDWMPRRRFRVRSWKKSVEGDGTKWRQKKFKSGVLNYEVGSKWIRFDPYFITWGK